MHDVLDVLKSATSQLDYSLRCIEKRPSWPKIVHDIESIQSLIDDVMRAVEKAGKHEQREAKKAEKAEARG